MTDNHLSPRPSRRTSGLLAATLLVVALSALGCDASAQTDATEEVQGSVRSGPLDVNRPTVSNLDPDFANEIWHYELALTLVGRCPDMLPDSSYRN